MSEKREEPFVAPHIKVERWVVEVPTEVGQEAPELAEDAFEVYFIVLYCPREGSVGPRVF